MVLNLSMQAAGEAGPFVLSLDYEPLECNEHLQVIRDYVSLPLDDRKLQSRFQPVLHKTVRETLRQETDRLDRMVGDYLRSVATMMDYPVSFSAGEYVLPLLKTVKCQPVLDGDSPLEQLMQYFELYAGLTKIRFLFWYLPRAILTMKNWGRSTGWRIIKSGRCFFWRIAAPNDYPGKLLI